VNKVMKKKEKLAGDEAALAELFLETQSNCS
jgi:hypothetical protein